MWRRAGSTRSCISCASAGRKADFRDGSATSVELQQLGRLAAARYGQEKLDYRPLVSILMRTYNTESTFLKPPCGR